MLWMDQLYISIIYKYLYNIYTFVTGIWKIYYIQCIENVHVQKINIYTLITYLVIYCLTLCLHGHIPIQMILTSTRKKKWKSFLSEKIGLTCQVLGIQVMQSMDGSTMHDPRSPTSQTRGRIVEQTLPMTPP